MTEDEDIPEWARPLLRGPIEINESTDPAWLAQEFVERLEALLQRYNIDASPVGWRALALRLILEREEFEVQAPVDRRAKTGGAEPGKFYWLGIRLMREARRLGSAKLAAEQERMRNPKSGLTVKRLQNLIADARAGKLAKPRWMARGEWDTRIEKALGDAAKLLEAGQSQN